MARAPELDRIIADFGKFPANVTRELRPALRKAAQPILRDAKQRASWSTRIPGAISLGASFTSRNPGVRLRVDASKAPHARPYEFGSGRNRNLRHPVFGRGGPANRRRWMWTEQQPRPFFFPAVHAGADGVVDETNAAVLAAARSAGFR